MASTTTETENYQYLLGLPIVSDLLRENKKLRKRNKELKRLIRLIGNNMSLLTPAVKRDKKTPAEVEIDMSDEDEDEVRIIEIKKEKVVVDVTEEDEPNIAYEIVADPEETEETVEEEEAVEETVEEEEETVEEEEAEEEEAVEETEEAVEEEAEEEEEAVEETEETDENEESGGLEETQGDESPAEDEEVYEVTINGKSYYTTNETSGPIYGLDENGDVSLEVGVYKAGKPTFF